MSALVVVVSDLHVGSTVGLCPPSVERDDGDTYIANPVQNWLWVCWHDFWEQVKERARRKTLYVVVNGDLVDGPNHHGTSQSVSSNLADELKLARDILAPIRKLTPNFFVVRGTQSHVGGAASHEEIVAAMLEAKKNGYRYTHDALLLDVEGVRFQFAHFGRIGRSLTNTNAPVMKAAAEHLFESRRRGWRPADVLIRSHNHRFADSGTTLDTRAFSTPAWQGATDYVKSKVNPDEALIADIGGLVFECREGRYEVEWVGRNRYVPEEPTPYGGTDSEETNHRQGRTRKRSA